MTRRCADASAFPITIAGMWLTATLVTAPALAATPRAGTVRVHDPVVLTGEDVPQLTGRSPQRIRVFAMRDGRARPIPFQIDARDERGNLVLDAPERPLDGNDDLLFMAMDAGQRASRDQLPEAADVAVEIETQDPRTGDRRWAYALHFPDATPPPSPIEYVHFDAETQRATSELYQVGYDHRGNFFTELRIAPRAGGSGANLVHRTRMRGAPTFSFLFGKFTLEFTEEDSLMELSGVKNGPVRATRQVDLSVDLGPLFPELPTGRVETHHYRSSFLTPAKVSIPWLVLKLARDFSFVALTDFRDLGDGARYFDSNYPAGLPYEGRPERVLTEKDHEWWVASGNGGSFLQAFLVPEEWRTWGVVRGTVFVDGEARALGRPTLAGHQAAGFSLIDVEDIPKAGDYTLEMFTAVFETPYRPGDEEDAMAMVREPLRVTARPLRRPEPLAKNDR